MPPRAQYSSSYNVLVPEPSHDLLEQRIACHAKHIIHVMGFTPGHQFLPGKSPNRRAVRSLLPASERESLPQHAGSLCGFRPSNRHFSAASGRTAHARQQTRITADSSSDRNSRDRNVLVARHEWRNRSYRFGVPLPNSLRLSVLLPASACWSGSALPANTASTGSWRSCWLSFRSS